MQLLLYTPYLTLTSGKPAMGGIVSVSVPTATCKYQQTVLVVIMTPLQYFYFKWKN